MGDLPRDFSGVQRSQPHTRNT